MAKVNGPLFSLGASGQLAKALVYAIWKGRPYVREYVTPSNPNSLGQRNTRSATAFFSKRWATLSSADQDSWNTLAAAGNYSPFNAYMKAGLDALAEGFAPSDNAAQARTAPTADTNPVLSSQGSGTVSGDVTQIGVDATLASIALILVPTGDTPATGASVVKYIAPPGDSGTTLFEITGLDPGVTYDLHSYGTSITGGVTPIDSPV